MLPKDLHLLKKKIQEIPTSSSAKITFAVLDMITYKSIVQNVSKNMVF